MCIFTGLGKTIYWWIFSAHWRNSHWPLRMGQALCFILWPEWKPPYRLLRWIRVCRWENIWPFRLFFRAGITQKRPGGMLPLDGLSGTKEPGVWPLHWGSEFSENGSGLGKRHRWWDQWNVTALTWLLCAEVTEVMKHWLRPFQFS